MKNDSEFSAKMPSSTVQHSIGKGKLNLSSKWGNEEKNKNCSPASCVNVLGSPCLAMKGEKKKDNKHKGLSKVMYALEMNWLHLSYLQKKTPL